MSIFFLSKPEYQQLLFIELSQKTRKTQLQIKNDQCIILNDSGENPTFSHCQTDFIFEQQRVIHPTIIEIEKQSSRKIAQCILENHFARIDQSKQAWMIHSFCLSDKHQLHSVSKNVKKCLLELIKEKLPRTYKRYTDISNLNSGVTNNLIVQLMIVDETTLAFAVNEKNQGVSPFEHGISRMKWDNASPSRSFLKIEEAFWYMNQKPLGNEFVIDLGASPGGWTYSSLKSGAFVTAIDNGPMKLSLSSEMKEKFTHLKQDGLSYLPKKTVDWLLCDMLVPPGQTLFILEKWLTRKKARHFVVNIKLPNTSPIRIAQEAKALLDHSHLSWYKIKSLYHNRQEITVMGSFL